jgi:hypothetical protein
VSLRFHLFTHLYEQLWDEVARYLTARLRATDSGAALAIEDGLRLVDRTRFDDADGWLGHLLVAQCLGLRASILQWREQHLNLPRNNLGGDLTKSLTGSPDAVDAVKHMRDVARARDPMLPLASARGLVSEAPSTSAGPLTRYLESEASLDHHMLTITGQVTQQRFKNVQERLGYFAERSAFAPPPRRLA